MPTVRASGGISDTPHRLIHLDLPVTLSGLLELALRELQRVEQDDRYLVDMGFWHQTVADNRECSVCMAGAVLSTYHGPHEIVSALRGKYDEETVARLEAIDMLRRGQVHTALGVLGIPHPGAGRMPHDRAIPPYSVDRDAFMIEMRLVLKDLREMEGNIP